jgi:hypothetical protein
MRTAGKRLASKAKPLAPEKHCEDKKNNPKVEVKFSGYQYELISY